MYMLSLSSQHGGVLYMIGFRVYGINDAHQIINPDVNQYQFMSGNLNKDQKGFKYVRRSLLHMKHKILFEIIEGRIMVFFFDDIRIIWVFAYSLLVMDGEVHPCFNSFINLNTVIWFL